MERFDVMLEPLSYLHIRYWYVEVAMYKEINLPCMDLDSFPKSSYILNVPLFKSLGIALEILSVHSMHLPSHNQNVALQY